MTDLAIAALTRPQVDVETNERWNRQTLTWQLLTEDFGGEDRKVREWFYAHVGARLDTWGPVDTSGNTKLTIAVLLSTPGLYGLGDPTLWHPSGAQGFADAVQASGYWTGQQYTQMMAVGMGDWVVRVDVIDGQLITQPIEPFNLWTRTDPRLPKRVIELRHLVIYATRSGLGYRWDAWDITNAENPTYRVLLPNGEPDPEFAAQSAVGPDYSWRYADGTPFIPFVFYARTETGRLWHDNAGKGGTRGALNTMLYWTFSQVAARDSSGTTVISIGVDYGTSVQTSQENGTPPSHKLALSPGSILLGAPMSDTSQPQIEVIPAGSNLDVLLRFADHYEQKQLSREGLASDDVTRNKANPTSAAALSISRGAKREVALRLMPFFRQSDTEMLRKMAAMMRVHGLGTYPETGWKITYQQLPLSAEEQEAAREEDDWNLEKGFESAPSIYARRYGVSLEDAVIALNRVAAENAMVGAQPPAPASAPPPPPTEPPAPAEPPDDPPEPAEPAPMEHDAEPPDLEDLAAVAQLVAGGILPPETGVELLVAAGVPREQASAIISPIQPKSADSTTPITAPTETEPE